MKKIFILIAIILFSITLTSCDEKNDDRSYVSLGINPQIDLIIDGNNQVVSVYAENEDAKVLLFEEDFVGMKFNDALNEITKLSIEYGYITEANDTIDFMISSTLNDKYQADLKGTIEKVMVDAGNDAGFNLVLKADSSFTLTRELEQLKAENPDNQAIQSLSIGKFKLITSATASDYSLSFNAALELTDEELITKISEARDDFYNTATYHYNVLATQSQIAYEKALNAFLRGIYATYYLRPDVILAHPVNYGALYNLYGMTSDTINNVYRLIKVVENYRNQPLELAKIDVIVNHIQAFGIEETVIREEIQDNEGNVTIASVNSYLDKVIKNLVTEKYQAEIEALKDTLNELNTTLKAQANIFKETYKVQIEAAMTAIEASYQALEAALLLLPESVKVYFTEFKNLITTFTDDLNGEFTVDTLGEWVIEFQAKEQAMLAKIKTDLTAEQIAEIEALQTQLSTDITTAKETLEREMKEALTQVKAELQALKDARKRS